MEELMIKVNALLRKEELRAKECFLKLKRNPEEMLRKNEISDYETDLKLQFYSNNEAINTKYGVEKGDPFYETLLLSTSMFEDDEFFNMDWATHGLKIPICYSMHDLWEHSNVDMEDLHAIDFVYYDMTFIYQFCIDDEAIHQ